MRPPDLGNTARSPPGPPQETPPPPPPIPTWRSSSPAYDPRCTTSGDGGQALLLHGAALPPLNLTRLGSSGGLHHRAGTPTRPSSPPPPDPATEADVWAALAVTATAGCADPVLAALADAADGTGGLRVAPALPFSTAPTAAAATTPALPHLAHPDSVEAPGWLERLLVDEKEGGSGEPSTSTFTSLQTPPIVVGARGAWLALPPHALAHWDRGGPFVPAGGPKSISYLALVPRGVEEAVHSFLTSITHAWAGSGLGSHAPAGGVVPGAGSRAIITYDASGGLPALGRAYTAVQRALARSRPPVRWPGLQEGEVGTVLGAPSPDGSLVVYLVPPPPGREPAAAAGPSSASALAALIACSRAPTAPPPPPLPPALSRLARSSDGGGGGGGSSAALRRLSSGTGAATTTTNHSRDSTPDWYRTAARDTYRRESGGGGGSRAGSPARSASGDGDGGPVAVPCTLQVLPVSAMGDDLMGRQARTLAFAVFNKVAVVVPGPNHLPLHYQALVALADPAGPTPALHCAFAVVPPPPSGEASSLIALAFTDGTGELAPGARVVRVEGSSSSALPGVVLAACGEVFSRAATAATREDARPTRLVITRLGAPPPAEASAWQAAVGGKDGSAAHHPPTSVLALSADPPFRLAGLGASRPGPFLAINADSTRACIVWEGGPGHAETVRAGVVAVVAGKPGALPLAAAELHALGALGLAGEAAVGGGGGAWGSASAHLPPHCATVMRLARLVAEGRRGL